MKEYFLIVDTEEHAENFKKPLAAYITGITDRNSTGNKYAELFHQQEGSGIADWIEENLEFTDGSPVKLAPTPGWSKDYLPALLSVEMKFSSKPSKVIINKMIKRAFNFCSDPSVKKISSKNIPKKIVCVRFVEKTVASFKVLKEVCEQSC